METIGLLFNVSKRNRKSLHSPFKENWHGLYKKDNQFTYSDATLIVPKNNKRK